MIKFRQRNFALDFRLQGKRELSHIPFVRMFLILLPLTGIKIMQEKNNKSLHNGVQMKRLKRRSNSVFVNNTTLLPLSSNKDNNDIDKTNNDDDNNDNTNSHNNNNHNYYHYHHYLYSYYYYLPQRDSVLVTSVRTLTPEVINRFL